MKSVHEMLEGSGGSSAESQKPVLITGGAGFIGTNLAHRYLQGGQRVVLFDNLSRPGVERNVEWLRQTHGDLVQLDHSDIRDAAAVKRAVKNCSRVFHFAAQVAVTASLTDPVFDFEVNARGTLNLLEALRGLKTSPPLVFTSSNKVYGELNDVEFQCGDSRYEPVNSQIRKYGFSETRPLQFHSPYGCSKGAAGQYVLDYARTFGLRAVVFHMSCIYGPHQCGNEDQGWVAHFLIRALDRAKITLYGDGRQVRDVLFVEDLVNAFLLANQNIDRLSGQSFNMGGGPENTISLIELLEVIATLNRAKPSVRFEDWRSADQRYYVSDIRRFSQATGWLPRVTVEEGVKKLFEWLAEERMASAPAAKSRSSRIAANVNGRRTEPRVKQPRGKGLWEGNGYGASRELITS